MLPDPLTTAPTFRAMRPLNCALPEPSIEMLLHPVLHLRQASTWNRVVLMTDAEYIRLTLVSARIVHYKVTALHAER